MKSTPYAIKKTKRGKGPGYLKKNYELYLMLVPGLLYLLIFHYIPLYGILIAFKDFDLFLDSNPMLSILKSPWVGLDNFREILANPDFIQVFKNTIIISLYKIIFVFPLPIILAMLLNEIRNIYYKKTLQTVLYLPHFLSWSVISILFVSILGSGSTIVELLYKITSVKFSFFTDSSMFRGLLVVTDAWQTIGWGSIIYLAAITGIDQNLYEAAAVDGAGKFKQALHITIPGIASTVVMMFIMRVGRALDAGFGQIFAMYNPTVYDVADIIGTYIYRKGLGQMDFTLGTTVGLFNSVIAFVLVVGSNKLSRVLSNKSIW